MAEAPDSYAAYYSDKLWRLLPSIYRTLDPTSPFDPNVAQVGPLQELVNRIGASAAVLRRSLDRLWEDQSIESCDDWVIPYIAAQLATNLVSGSDARQQRLDVANTIDYRRRKGTLPLLEELARDVTGWEARVVEMFQRLGRARHGLDPAIDRRSSRRHRTPSGGYADLRNTYRASRAHTAFDEFSHTVDVRLGSGPGASADIRHGIGETGWYNLENLAIFLFRLESVSVDGVTPVAFQDDPSRLTFDPTGREVQLFAAPLEVHDASWGRRREDQLPGPIDRSLLEAALGDLYGADVSPDGVVARRAIALYPTDASGFIASREISADPRRAGDKYVIDPERGIVRVPAGAPAPLQVGYRYGFSSTLGAGGYDRRLPGRAQATGAITAVTGGGDRIATIGGGILEIQDSLTYDEAPPLTIGSSANSLVVRAVNFARPVVRPTAAAQWTFTGVRTGSGASAKGSTLVLDGLLVCGCDVVLAGDFDEVTLSTTTLDPGEWRADTAAWATAADGRQLVPARLVIAGTVRCLTIDRCIVGPVITERSGSVETVTIADSVVHATAPGHRALGIATGMTTMSRCTVLGPGSVHAIEASDSIFDGALTAADDQRGCVRYCAWSSGSTLPRQYASVTIERGRALFASTVFGHPEYAALTSSVDPEVGAGAESGSEMGVFSREHNPIKERSLLIKYQEYMPIGLVPVLIYVT